MVTTGRFIGCLFGYLNKSNPLTPILSRVHRFAQRVDTSKSFTYLATQITVENINKALQDLRDAKAAKESVSTKFLAKCNELVKAACDYMKITGQTIVKIGDSRQGVEITNAGSARWNGLVTSAILEGYEKSLLEMIQNETNRIVADTNLYR